MNKNKKLISIIGVVAILILVIGGLYALGKMSSKSKETPVEETKKKRSRAQENIISVEERPYVVIKPQLNGRNVVLEVVSLKKEATSAEYELEYQAGSLLQGAFGSFELASLPATEDVLLGSCSAGGACTYHEDVRGGSLLLDFQGGDNYVLKQDWKYIINSDRETAHSSRDAKFQIDGTNLGKQSYIIIYNTPGAPEGLEGSIASDPYSLQTSSALSGTAELTMRANQEGNLAIMGYDGEAWHEFETSVDGKSATAEVDLMEAYVVVVK